MFYKHLENNVTLRKKKEMVVSYSAWKMRILDRRRKRLLTTVVEGELYFPLPQKTTPASTASRRGLQPPPTKASSSEKVKR